MSKEELMEEWVNQRFFEEGGTVGNVALYEDLCVEFEHLWNKGHFNAFNTTPTMAAYDVYLIEETECSRTKTLIDTVYFHSDMSCGQVKKSLIDHDGYDTRIQVQKRRKEK